MGTIPSVGWMIRRLLFRICGYRLGANTWIPLRSLLRRPSGTLRIGSDSRLSCRFDFERREAEIIIGDRVFIGRSHIIAATRVEIEDDVLISWGVTIVDNNSHALSADDRADDVTQWALAQKDWSKVAIAPTILKRGCWLGFNSIILKGVTVGDGAVVGAGSVVTKDVPPHTVVVGNPARVVRHLKSNNTGEID